MNFRCTFAVIEHYFLHSTVEATAINYLAYLETKIFTKHIRAYFMHLVLRTLRQQRFKFQTLSTTRYGTYVQCKPDTW